MSKEYEYLFDLGIPPDDVMNIIFNMKNDMEALIKPWLCSCRTGTNDCDGCKRMFSVLINDKEKKKVVSIPVCYMSSIDSLLANIYMTVPSLQKKRISISYCYNNSKKLFHTTELVEKMVIRNISNSNGYRVLKDKSQSLREILNPNDFPIENEGPVFTLRIYNDVGPETLEDQVFEYMKLKNVI
jgi:hypothetical protein